jgi:predicted PurR-regulated permease PerM
VSLKAVAGHPKPQNAAPDAAEARNGQADARAAGPAGNSSRPDPRSDSEASPEPPIDDPQSDAPLAIRMPVDIRSAALTVLAGIAIVLVLQYAQAMIIPIVLAVLISYALEPVVAWIERRRVPRPVGAAIVLLALVGAGGWMLYSLRSQATAIVEQLPHAATRLRRMMENDRPKAATAIQQVQKAAAELEKAADAAAPPPPSTGIQRVQVETRPINIGDYVMWGSLGIVAAAGQFVLILFLVYFLLSSGDLYRRKLVKIVGPSLTDKKVTVQILQEIDRQIEMFLFVQLFTSSIVGVATWLAFRALGVEQAAVWGLLAGLFNSIPYFGPVIVTGATSVVGFLQFGDLRMAVTVGAVSLIITSLEGFLLTPWLTSRAARMNAVAIFVGLLFWGWVWNVWGMLLAVPMLMVMKVVCDHVEDFNGIGELLGD